ncbi:hypothetical protein [Novosphingobium humi]|uniref:Transposase n=1 Tax=Novosphingobium humi TaxID=2282397 RepID=A0ABY7U1J3_9SPHN|nr:hypothetical protein [Novosphingobium humi]WCT78626.1 hypothetical protein PQ457_06600 [Novosphingobium humi]
MAKTLSAATMLKLAEARQMVLDCIAAEFTSKFIIRRLQSEFGASFRYARGTTVLRCARVEVCNSSGNEIAMLAAWAARADRLLDPKHNCQTIPMTRTG